ncbi:MAG: hypothetical protein JWP29_4479, partial [Rhodoferax sp.]|nr:hypothetical protein [Rhodoferax sp.]
MMEERDWSACAASEQLEVGESACTVRIMESTDGKVA